MNTHEEIELTREVEAIQIPSGNLVTLPAGTKVMITQALGGTYTVATQTGMGLARISKENADALGIDLEAEREKKNAAEEISALATDQAEVARSGCAEQGPGHRHHRLPRAGLLRSGDRALDPRRAEHRPAG